MTSPITDADASTKICPFMPLCGACPLVGGTVER